MADISQIQFPDGTVYDIKDPVARAAAGDAGAGKIFYGVCSTGASTQTKVVTIEDFELFTGALIAVKFDNVNTATAPKLNVSGTGAINMYSVGTTAVLPNAWVAGETLLFVYNGTSYMVADGGIASTSGYGATKLNSATDSTSTTEAATPSAVKSAYDLAQTANNNIPDVSGKLDKSGGTMTGALVLVSDPTADLQAATKQYVDAAVDNSGINPLKYYWNRCTYFYETVPPLSSFTSLGSSNSEVLYLGVYNNDSNRCTIVYDVADSLTIDPRTGAVSLLNPVRITLGGSKNDDLSQFTANKYFKMVSYTNVGSWGYPSSPVYRGTNVIYDSPNRIWYSAYAPEMSSSGTAWRYRVTSTIQIKYYNFSDSNCIYDYPTFNDDEIIIGDFARNAYPDDSEYNAYSEYYPYSYKYLGSGSDLLPKSYVVGNYTGAGGAVTLTFDYPVNAMIVVGDFYSFTNGTDYGVLMVMLFNGIYIGTRWGPTSTSNAVSVKGPYTVSGNSVTLPVQLNRNGKTYNYIAFF